MFRVNWRDVLLCNRFRCKLNTMHSYRTVEKQKVYIVTPESLARLANALPVDKNRLKFKMECSDGTTLYPAGIDELLSFPNPKSREILTIEMSTSYQAESRCEINFSNDIFRSVTYTVSGEDSFVVSTSDIVEQHLESMNGRGPYFLANSLSLREGAVFLIGFPAALLFSFGLASCYDILVEREHIYMGTFMFNGFTSTVMFILGCIALLVAIKSKHILSYFFPNVSFCIGSGDARYRHMIEQRKLFGLGTLVAFILGILGNWFANMLPTH